MWNCTNFYSAKVPSAPSPVLLACQHHFMFITFTFWIITYHLHASAQLASTLQQLWKTMKTLRRNAVNSFQHCCTTQVLVYHSLFCHACTASPEQIIKMPHNTVFPMFAPEIIFMAIGLHWGTVQTNNCELLCIVWVEDIVDMWTIKVIIDNCISSLKSSVADL